MRMRSVVWGAALVVLCGAVFPGCKKSERSEYGGEAAATPSAGAGAMTGTEATPAPSLTSEVAGAQLSGPGGTTGVITFTQDQGGVHVVARVEHASPGKHGFHLHAGGTCAAPDFKSAGDHFNPANAPHGAPDAGPHHAGDFGNIEVGADGSGNLDLTTTLLSVEPGPNSVLGKAVILHKGADDLKTQPSGNSGDRIACGVVQRAQGQAETGAVTPTPAPGDVMAHPTPAPNGAEH